MAASNLQDVDSVSAFIDSSLSQSDAATTIAAGTLGLVILVWASYLGLKRDIDTQGFRWLGFLVFPFVLGLVAVICSYVLYALTTGCRFELMTG